MCVISVQTLVYLDSTSRPHECGWREEVGRNVKLSPHITHLSHSLHHHMHALWRNPVSLFLICKSLGIKASFKSINGKCNPRMHRNKIHARWWMSRKNADVSTEMYYKKWTNPVNTCALRAFICVKLLCH